MIFRLSVMSCTTHTALNFDVTMVKILLLLNNLVELYPWNIYKLSFYEFVIIILLSMFLTLKVITIMDINEKNVYKILIYRLYIIVLVVIIFSF